jgi:hypothetical protein
VAQKLCVQGLEESECPQARGKALLPRRRAATLGACGVRKEHESERHERFAGSYIHLLRLSRLVSAGSPACE